MKGVDQMIEDILKEKKNMTNGEERIADYFLDKKTLLRKQSSRSIASQLFINPSMITRFCQKLGFHGYTDFLEQYLKEIALFKKIVALGYLIQQKYRNDIRNMLP